MTLRERLQADTTAAMRSGDALRRDVLRMAQNTMYNIEKAKKVTLSEDEVLGVLTREVKTRRESVEAFRSGGREDLAAKEEAEIAILQGYLPHALTEAEIGALVEEAVAATGASSARDLGKVMGWLVPEDPRPRRREGRLRARRPGARPRGPRGSRHGALSGPSRDARSHHHAVRIASTPPAAASPAVTRGG